VAGGTGGDGVAFVVQNYGLDDTAGSGGEKLGFLNTVDRFLAVGFLPALGKVRLYTREAAPALAKTVAEANVPGLGDGAAKTASLSYLNDTQTAVVKLGGATVLSAALGKDLVSIMGGGDARRFATLGFSASTTSASYADISVGSLALKVQPPDSAVSEGLNSKIIFGRTQTFVLVKRDSCQATVPFASNASRVFARLSYRGPADGPEKNFTAAGDVEGRDFLDANVTYDAAKGQFLLQFDMPSNVVSRWDLDVLVDGVRSAGMPCRNCVETRQPDPPTGIPTWGLALLICIIVIIIASLCYALWRLKRYRQKLAENADNIEAGKEKHHLDMLEKDVTFQMNPLMGSLDEMKSKLKANELELQRLRAGKGAQFDDQHMIGELQLQNAELREEMNKLKIEAQQNEALNTSFRPAGPSGAGRKQFEPSRASVGGAVLEQATQGRS
jgi:hypothetical protein